MKLLILILAILELSTANVHRGSRIVFGLSAVDNQFPYQALLIVTTPEGPFQCGGSLISSTWVLTAAHCSDRSDYKIKVSFGSIDRNFMTVTRNSIKFIAHPDYNPILFSGDIAVCQLDKAVPFSKSIQPVPLASCQPNRAYLDKVVTVAGFGKTTLSNEASLTLLYTQLKVVSNKECDEAYNGEPKITSDMICGLGDPFQYSASCAGDSGGGWVLNGTLVAVIAFGEDLKFVGCANGIPEVATSVSPYLDWITQKTGVVTKSCDTSSSYTTVQP